MLDEIWNLFQSRAVGNLALLLAAIIGVGGNFYLYRHKRKKRRQKLREAIHAELSSMKPVVNSIAKQKDIVRMDPVDPRSFLVSTVYDSSSDDLGLLSDEEVVSIVDFYSTGKSIQRLIGDDHNTAYKQVGRRDLGAKLEQAMRTLEENSSNDLQRRNPHRMEESP